jgi:hypothetical protein
MGKQKVQRAAIFARLSGQTNVRRREKEKAAENSRRSPLK